MADPVSYEDARDELIAVVQRLETGGTSLQESIELWERGEELAKICQRWLDGARARLDAVMDPPTADRAGSNLDGRKVDGADSGPLGGDVE